MKRRWIVGAVGSTAALVWFAGTTWVWTGLDPRALPKRAPAPGTTLSARSCQPCHDAIYQEWRGSRMGQAMTDPVFVADYELQGQPFVCLRCHAPLHEQSPQQHWGLLSVKPLIPLSTPNPDFDADLQAEGVTCVVCHLEEGAMVGPLEDPQAPHPAQKGDLNRACARCHQVEITPLSNLDRPITDTVREWERWKALTGRSETCVDCHMPLVERVVGLGGPTRTGHRHTWHGAWDVETLRSALDVDVEWTEDEVIVHLENLAGHHVPSGDPARALVVRAGTEEVVIARRVPLPRLIDEGDNTLQPGERRTLRLPNANPVQVRFERLRFLDVGIVDDGVVLYELSP